MNVTVIIPVYNAEKFIRKSVESALIHNEVKEILLIEDGSPDNSLKICEDLAHENDRVKILRHPGGINKGAGASRNLGLNKASQEYICFLDADDYMTDIRFKKEQELFVRITEIDGVYGAIGTQYYDDIGGKAWERHGWNENHLTTVNKQIPPEQLFEYLIDFSNPSNYKGYFHIDGLTIKRNSLRKINILFNESLKLHQDSVFILQCAYYLKLHTGEFQYPISIRGVHKDNRYITQQSLIDSRSKQWQILINWSRNEKLKKEYQDVFKGNYYLNLYGQGLFQSIILLFKYFPFNSYFRKMVLYKFYKKYFRKNHINS